MEIFKKIIHVLYQIAKPYIQAIINILKRGLKIFGRFWKKKHLSQILLLVGLTVVLITILSFSIMASRANVQSLKDGLSQSTAIYDRNGELATTIDTNRSEGVDVKEIPEYVPNAVIAIEDRRFKEHNGFDLKGMSRAFVNNLISGKITGGGSTITQQLAKNALLTHDQTYKRKIEELFLSLEIEKKYSKDEIMSMYLNHVYFGSGAWGIENATKKYLNKAISEITISEAAMLAGLLQSPSYLDPYQNYDRAMERRNVVLNSMNELGMITADEFKSAKEEKITLQDGGGSRINRDYPYYADAVLDEAIIKYGLTQEEIMTRGYRIYTELDQRIQQTMEEIYKQDSLFPTAKKDSIVQSGAIFLDPHTGGVRGLIGGRGEYVFRGFNRSTHMKAQPGSTIKPLVVYAPALEEGFDKRSILKDEKITFGDYSPENFNRTYSGEVPMYEALSQSLNLPTVWLLNEIGLEKGIDSLEKFGISVEQGDHHLGISLGGMSKGVSPQQLAEAYSVFANEGKRQDSHLITKIIGPTGNLIAEHQEDSVKVTSKKVAEEMTSMLLGVVENGTGKSAQIPGFPIAGKTGSTQLPYKDINGTKDQWFVGYTPSIVGAVWLGYDKTDQQHYLSSSSSETVVPIFRVMMERIRPYIEEKEFNTQSVYSEELGDTNEKEETLSSLKEQTDIVKERLKEEAPKWKEKLDRGIKEVIEKGNQMKDGLDHFIEKIK